jgi:hypothetical protein
MDNVVAKVQGVLFNGHQSDGSLCLGEVMIGGFGRTKETHLEVNNYSNIL